MTTVTQEPDTLECEHFFTFCFLIYFSQYVLPIITFADASLLKSTWKISYTTYDIITSAAFRFGSENSPEC